MRVDEAGQHVHPAKRAPCCRVGSRTVGKGGGDAVAHHQMTALRRRARAAPDHGIFDQQLVRHGAQVNRRLTPASADPAREGRYTQSLSALR
jgi:hypothetical protein